MTKCRFIEHDPRAVAVLGERIFCGEPVHSAGSAWCARHFRICYGMADEEGGKPRNVLE